MSLSKENRGFKNYKEMKEGQRGLERFRRSKMENKEIKKSEEAKNSDESSMPQKIDAAKEFIQKMQMIEDTLEKSLKKCTEVFQVVLEQRNVAVNLLKKYKYTTSCKCGATQSISVGNHEPVKTARDSDCLHCNTKDFLKLFGNNDE